MQKKQSNYFEFINIVDSSICTAILNLNEKSALLICCSWKQKTKEKYLSQYFHDHWHHSILLGEALERHVSGRPAGGDEDVSAGCFKGDILHVRSHPAVGLSKHGFWSQSGSYQEDGFAFHAAVGKLKTGLLPKRYISILN